MVAIPTGLGLGVVKSALGGISWQAYVGAAMLAAIGLLMWRADTISEERDGALQAYAASENRHAVTAASLSALEAELAAMVSDGQLRAERLQKAMQDVEKETAPLREQAKQFDIQTVEGL